MQHYLQIFKTETHVITQTLGEKHTGSCVINFVRARAHYSSPGAPRPRVARVHDTRNTFPARTKAMNSLGDGARREYETGRGAIGLLESDLQGKY